MPQGLNINKCCSYNNIKAPQIILGGDIVFDQGILTQFAHQKYNLRGIFDEIVRNIFKPTDVFCFNFEGVISKNGTRQPKALPPAFSFRSPPEILDLFKDLAKPIFVLANNHIMDFGREALEDMLVILSAQNINYVGADKNEVLAIEPCIVSSDSFKVAILAYTNLLPYKYYARKEVCGAAKLTNDNLKKGINQARAKGANFIIVSLHTIGELNSSFSFFPDSYQIWAMRQAVLSGADVVFGHQPHGLQLWEWFKGKPIFYSLGALVYNPALGTYFPKKHKFYESAQVYGGGIVTLKFCKHALPLFNIVPTRAVKDETGNVKIIHDSRIGSVCRLLANKYLPQELWALFRESLIINTYRFGRSLP